MESRQGFGFAFEPEYSEEEIARMDALGCIEAESSDTIDEGADHDAGRLGNIDWCSCEPKKRSTGRCFSVLVQPGAQHVGIVDEFSLADSTADVGL